MKYKANPVIVDAFEIISIENFNMTLKLDGREEG